MTNSFIGTGNVENNSSIHQDRREIAASQHRELLVTKDGSHTILVPSLDITYRSRHGAIQESLHVSINAGLQYKWSLHSPAASDNAALKVFELGLGTGLNALLSCQAAVSSQRKILYTAIEPEPLRSDIIDQLNYPDPEGFLAKIHAADWNVWVEVNPFFSLLKYKSTLADFPAPGLGPVTEPEAGAGKAADFDLVYYDAFGPLTQPELWSAASFAKIASLMKPGAILTTYCTKSVVRKTMMSVGLKVNKIPGPYGKREMVRAVK